VAVKVTPEKAHELITITLTYQIYVLSGGVDIFVGIVGDALSIVTVEAIETSNSLTDVLKL